MTRAIVAVAVVATAATAQAQLARESPISIREAWPSCAGDGLPPPPTLHAGQAHPWSAQLSALAMAWGVPYAGGSVRMTDLDAVDGTGLYLASARLGACGLYRLRAGTLMWNVVYEPYALDEAAQPDARAWGRFAAGEIGFAPWRWLMLSIGVRKIAFSYGHDEPLQALALPVRPYVSQSIAPDRRLGLTIDDDFGVAHVVLGVYQGRRDLVIDANGGLLLSARLVAEPIGPVGDLVSTVFDPPLWRDRARFAVNASILYQYANGSSTYALGADGAMHWGPVGVVGEYLYSSGTTVEAPVRHVRPRAARSGLWLEAAVMLLRPWLEVAARYDWLDEPAQAGQQFHAVTAGLTGYIFDQRLRVQTLYTHKIHFGLPSGRSIPDDVLLFSGTLALDRIF
jgi:hypothetical protein